MPSTPVLALALGLALAFPVAAASQTTIVWQGYTGLPVGTYCHGILRAGDCPSLSSSQVQFGPFSASAVDIQVRDDTGRQVGASYVFYAPDGGSLATGSFCAQASGLRMPDGASYLVVTVDNPVTPQHCGLASPGVSGWIMLRLR